MTLQYNSVFNNPKKKTIARPGSLYYIGEGPSEQTPYLSPDVIL